MTLNIVWLSLFFISACFGFKSIITGDNPGVFADMMAAAFEAAKTSFDLALGLTGMLTFWMGFIHIAEKAGGIAQLSRIVAPFLKRIFPGIPPDHPAMGAITLNFVSNFLGLDNVATPIGLKAMKALQTLNKDPKTITSNQTLFIVLHSASLTLVPISIIAFRVQLKATNPADVFIPILFASLCAALGGFFSTAIIQRNIKFRDPVLLMTLIGGITFIGSLLAIITRLPRQQMEAISNTIGSLILFLILLWFLILATWRKVNAWETFIEGAQDGFKTALQIMPFLVGIFVAIGIFRASGGMHSIVNLIWKSIAWTGLPPETVGAIPTLLMKPLSGSAARVMMLDAMNTYGVDSFAGRLACLFNGSTDTTLYIIAIYTGSVGIKNTRYALPCSLIADISGFLGAILIAVLFFN